MWDLVSAQDTRKYQIIEFLFKSPRPVTIGELASALGASPRIIQYDLEQIKQYISHAKGEIISSHEGIFLYFPTSIGLDHFQRLVFDQSEGFAFLEKVFFNENMQSEDMINYLFMSESSFRRLVTRLRSSLEEFGFKLEANPYRIGGPESLIRKFFTSYFEERYSVADWPFAKVDFDFLNDAIKTGIHYFNIPVDAAQFNRYRIQFAVNVTRGMQGYQLPDLTEADEQSKKIRSELFLEVLEPVRAKHDISVDTLESYFHEFNDWEIYFSIPYNSIQLEEDETLRERVDKVHQMILQIEDVFSLPKEDHYYLAMLLNRVMDFSTVFPNHKTKKKFVLFDKQRTFYNELISNEFPAFYANVKDKIIELTTSRFIMLNDVDLEYLVFIFLSNWRDLIPSLYKAYHDCKILVYSHLHLNHARMIAQHIEQHLNRSITFEVYSDIIFSEELLKNYDFDILVTTQSLFFDLEQPIVYVDYFIEDEDIKVIANLTKKNRALPL